MNKQQYSYKTKRPSPIITNKQLLTIMINNNKYNNKNNNNNNKNKK